MDWVHEKYEYAVKWTKTFMILVGVISSVAFIRVNFFGHDVMLDMPNTPIVKKR